jgi:capsular polysaccharide biosynthesis protein
MPEGRRMELNEALHRVVVGHWRLLAVLLVLPLLIVGALHALASPAYVATARVQASSTSPSTDTEADAVLNRVAGVVTSTSVVNQAMEEARINNRNAAAVAADEVSVTRLGSSAVFNLSVTDSDPRIATGLAAGLTTQLVTFLNGTGDPQGTALVKQLTDQQNALRSQRQSTAAQLAQAGGPAATANLQAQLSTLDQQLGDVQSSLRQLQAAMVTSGGSAAAISLPSSAVRAASTLVTDLGLGVLTGLVVGLLIATALETLRPRVVDSRAFARELEVPPLGRLVLPATDDPAGRIDLDFSTLLATRQAIVRSGVGAVMVTGPLPTQSLSGIARLIEEQSAAVPKDIPTSIDGAAGHSAPPSPVLDVLPGHGRPAIEAHPLPVEGSDVDGRWTARRQGLIVVTPNLALLSEVRRVRDLAAATGWPVLGVLGASRRRRAGLRWWPVSTASTPAARESRAFAGVGRGQR